MKTERILIFTDKHKQAELENSVEATQQGANRLIDLYHNFQPWNKIQTIEDFETLCIDPLKTMDQTLITNSGIDLKATGGKLPNPEMVSKMLDIDRENFTNIVKGQKIDPGSCKPCGKLKVIQTGKGVLNYTTYQQYQEYLLFNEGRFSINEDLIAEKVLSFQVYAETPEQTRIWEYWHNVLDVLNSLNSKGYCGDLYAFQGLLKNRVMYSYATNKLALDEQSLYYEISQLKNK